MALRRRKSYVRFVYYRLPILRARLARLLRRETPPAEQAGQLHHPGNVHAVFLIWQPIQTPWYVKNALEALAQAGINVTLVVNHPLDEARLAELAPWVDRLMLRDNTGFDMGGYRDAILSFAGRAPERLLVLNDSVYYFRAGLTDLFQRLATSSCDVCAAYENWDHHYHIQSFCYSISRHVLEQPAFQRFWQRYLPVNVRRWAIHRGEVRSSRCMVRQARSIEVLFSPARLRAVLDELDPAALRDLAPYLPIDLRPALRGARLRQEVLVAQLLDAVMARSQIHSGGFLYRRFLGAPMLKRDLVFRSQYHLHEVETLLHATGEESHAPEILTDMRVKGVGAQLRGRARMRFLLDL
ncbi:rhamnan synthesis F family protein [Ancylobacter vacuolatus]|uniref:Rhamnan synthesis protein F n=1 Tax=Ancylobacter vacuolatus TaxID=223389 RepID=A0ABU0DE72_9HYPH|nr:rhamnan synthesis F family protein [Ancylobacter vacuolatus]MDQ0346646.1 hypothetical protein [Ancylobacter vacuolatus]